MAEFEDTSANPNGVPEETAVKRSNGEVPTLYGVLRRLVTDVFFPDPDGKYGSVPFTSRLRGSVSENAPLLRDASRNTGQDILLWARSGSHLRALLVVSVGTVAFLTLTGLVIFALFFLAATASAIAVSLLVSLAVAGGFLALFFASLTVIYIGALSVAVFAISTATISAIVAVFITAGWIGFFLTVWLATKKSVHLAKHSITLTGSALTAYSSARHARNNPEPDKSVVVQ